MLMVVNEAWEFVARLRNYNTLLNTASSYGGMYKQQLAAWVNNNLPEKEQEEPVNLCVRDGSKQFLDSELHANNEGNRDLIRTDEGTTHLSAFSPYPSDSNHLSLYRQLSAAMYPSPGSETVHTDSSNSANYPSPNHSQKTQKEPLSFLTSTPLRINPSLMCSSDIWPATHKQDPDLGLLPGGQKQEQETSAVQKSHGRNTTSSRLARRRRVGWRGMAMCAACGLVYPKMDQLNLHYAVAHAHLLALEWRLAQYNSTKASKLLFQAQLDRLRSEKASESDSVGSNSAESAHKQSAPCQFAGHRTSGLSETSGHLSQTSKSTSSFISPKSSQLSCNSVDLHKRVDENAMDVPDEKKPAQSDLDLMEQQSGKTDSVRGRQSKGYPCPRCAYTAKWPTELQKHVMVHANSRPFVCSVCSTSYKWSWDLGRHFSNAHPTLLNPYKRQRPTRQSSSSVSQNQKCPSGTVNQHSSSPPSAVAI
ncbi:unnamed protein product [Calicophoron daubneyi]|uniref:C2H2-type domain-containing protein n=1 Tax=Calicophoron daubneyi TaxID=300641 RepID=A0AAV2TMP0_CALDB